MFLFYHTATGFGKSLHCINSDRVVKIEQCYSRIIITVDVGEKDYFSDFERFLVDKYDTVELKYDSAEKAEEKMRQFYSVCVSNVSAFYF